MPLIRDEDIDEVRQRADILDVVSGQVTLKKAGRLYKGLCPFHDEKTPSFTVNPERQTYHCFGCGEGGNVISFIMKTENLDFPEAVQALADRVGFTLRYVEGTTVKKEPANKQARVYAANDTALRFFQESLLKTDEGKAGLAYFKNRGYEKAVIDRFRLGYAPNAWEALADYAGKQGFKRAEMLEAGLAVKSDKNPNRSYDRFRGRVIFPIFDLQDRTIGFGGRVLDDTTPKYLNSPETPVFHKGRALYAMNWAKDAIKKDGEAVIVEGYTDVISLMLAGVENVVATLGTALGSDHLKLLSRYTHRVVLVFDADEAGQKAAARGLELMREFYLGPEYRKFDQFSETRHLDLFVATLPNGQDPADFAAKSGGDEFKKLVSKAKPLVDFCLNTAFRAGDRKSFSGRQQIAARAVEIIAVLPSPVAREQYLKAVADNLQTSYEALFEEFSKYAGRQQRASTGRPSAAPPAKKDPARTAESAAVRFILQSARGLALLEDLTPEHFSHPDLRDIFKHLQEEQRRLGRIDPAALLERLEDEEEKRVVTALTSESSELGDETRLLRDLSRRIKELEIARRITIVKAEMQDVDPAVEPAKYDELFSRLLDLEAERREILATHD